MPAIKTDDLVAYIRSGEYDDAIVEVIDAFKFRIAGGAVGVRWKLEAGGVTVTEDDITLGELEQVERACDVNWQQLNPGNSAQQCAEILRVCGRTRLGLNMGEAQKLVDGLTAADMQTALSEYALEGPLPKD